MRITIKPTAVSWRHRTVQVCNEWARVADSINLLQIRVGQEHEVEITTALDGNKVIERIHNVK